mmetsp:Transcript_82429/g.163554  ORF Transcript_82429/g.163554 Transcript_82429/m.163554 type:complete len:114 (+) Transcript_82429:925-1266(+)
MAITLTDIFQPQDAGFPSVYGPAWEPIRAVPWYCKIISWELRELRQRSAQRCLCTGSSRRCGWSPAGRVPDTTQQWEDDMGRQEGVDVGRTDGRRLSINALPGQGIFHFAALT